MSRTAIFDIETNGLLLDLDTIWCAVVYDVNTNQYIKFTPDNIKDLPKCLFQYDTLIGHNIIGFDLFAIKKIYPNFSWENKTIIDTLTLSKLVYYDKDNSFSHSLKAWGERLDNYKDHHEDWSRYSPEMLEYCTQDVSVTRVLYQHLERFTWITQETLNVEQKVQEIITQQYINGWTFDIKKAQELHIELLKEYEEALNTLRNVFKPMLLPVGKTKTYKKVPTVRDGVEYYTNQSIALTEFNPSSGQHIVWWIDRLYGKQKWELTDKGNPKTDATTISEMFSDKDWAKPLIHFFNVKKLLGMLAEGDNAWLKLVRNGRIHHQVDILGTNTGRATHNTPNLAQVPSARAYKGKEVRSLFRPSKGMVNVGCDLSGVELRCLAHYMAIFDKGAYGDIILKGDIHTANQQAAGLATRDMAKTMIYCYLYGGGDAKLGLVVNGGAKEGKKIRSTFETKIPALKQLTDSVKKASKKGFLIGITGRRLKIRSEHSALNVLLQSLGAYISKQWMIEAHRMIKEEGIICKQNLWCHDELQFECVPDQADRLKNILEKAANIAGERLKLRCQIDAEAKSGDSWYACH